MKTVDVSKLPVLKLGSAGKAVTWAKIGVNKHRGVDGNTTPIYGPFFPPLVKEFKHDTWCGDHGKTGVIGELTWIELLKYIPASIKEQMPQKLIIPEVGPVEFGGKSILDQQLTHATSGIPLYPAFDAAFGAGKTIIAPEAITITKKYSTSNPGLAFYAEGVSGLDYWFGHLDRRHPLGTKFRRGDFLGRTVPTDIGGGPHVHVGVNGERILGEGKEFIHHKNYTYGAPTIREQLTALFS